MEGNDLPPIIVKKKKGGHGAHGGAWKVAYADFVTAMMALFIVLWVLGQDTKTKQSIAHYFQNPTKIYPEGGGSGFLPGEGASATEMKKSTEILIETEKEQMNEMGKEIMDELKSQPEFRAIIDMVKFEITPEGLQIELTEKENNVFFEIGSAKLNPKAIQILHLIAKQLVKMPNKISVEGHTDARPYSYAKITGYSNWELSSDRASAARKELANGGVGDEQFSSIIGYADRKLKKPDDPLSTENRRISIIVKFNENK